MPFNPLMSPEDELIKKLQAIQGGEIDWFKDKSDKDAVTDQLLREQEDRLANPGKKIVYQDAEIDNPVDEEIVFPEPIKLPETQPLPELRQEKIVPSSPPTMAIADSDRFESKSPYQLPEAEFDKLISNADKVDDNQSLWTSIARAWANAGEGMTGVTSDKGLWDNLERQAKRHGQRARSRIGEQKQKLEFGRDLAKEDPNSPEALAVKKMLSDSGYGGVVRPEMNIRQMEGAFGKYWDTIYQAALRKYVADSDRDARITEKGMDREFQRDLQADKNAMTINENEKDRLARESLEKQKAEIEARKKLLPEGPVSFLNDVPSEYRDDALKEYKGAEEHGREVGNIISTAKEIYKIGPVEAFTPSYVPFVKGQKEAYDAALAKLGSAVMKIVPGLRSDQDAIRYVKPMLPKPTETAEVAEVKMKRFEDWLNSFRPETPLLKNLGKEKNPTPAKSPSKELDSLEAKKKRIEELRKKLGE